MRFTTYSKYHPELADAVNLQGLLDQLGDFLLQSGFAGGSPSFWHDEGSEGERSLESLRQAILQALMESGQLSKDMLKVLRGESTGDEERDRQVERDLGELLDRIVQRLIEEGYLNVGQAPEVPEGYQSMFGPGGQAHSAAQQVQFNLTEKGIDFLGYKTLKSLLGSVGKSSFGAHDTPYLATGVEAEGVSKPYEFGDVLNLDVPATLTNAIAREGLGVPINIEYGDLMVSQSEYRSSAATVLMLDCSHSMILYGEDRFTPAKKVALALTHLIRTQFPGDTLRVVLFHDSAEEIPLSALAQAQVGPYHTNTAEGLKLARRILLAQKKDMRQIIMITDGKPSALTMPDGRVYENSMGLDPQILQATYREVSNCRRSGHHDQHLHAGARPEPGGVRQAGGVHLQGEGVLHQHDDAGAVHPDGLHETEDEEGVVSGAAGRGGIAAIALSLFISGAWNSACGRGAGTGAAPASVVPLSASQAPMVTVRQIVERDSLVGRRVRVGGVCAIAGTGPSAGVWLLQAGPWAIEVRGLVPRSCFREPVGSEALTIFAQIVEGTDSTERLLLRLPD